MKTAALLTCSLALAFAPLPSSATGTPHVQMRTAVIKNLTDRPIRVVLYARDACGHRSAEFNIAANGRVFGSIVDGCKGAPRLTPVTFEVHSAVCNPFSPREHALSGNTIVVRPAESRRGTPYPCFIDQS